jgi:PAS domain S-box-containing protein
MISRNGLRAIRPHLLGLALFEIAFLLAYRSGMSFTQELAAPFWFPDSILLSALLITPPNTWWMYIAGTIPIRLFLFVPAGTPFWYLLSCLANDSLKCLLSAWLLRRISRPPVWLENLRDFIRYFSIAVLLAPAISAFAAAPLRVYLGDSFWRAWSNWFLGDALASLILAPLLICFVTEHRRYTRQTFKRYAVALFIAVGVMAGAYVVFDRGSTGQTYSPFLWYLPTPFLLWAAVSYGPMGTSASLFVMSWVAILETISGRGPFSPESADASLRSIQLFLVFVSVPFMFLSVLSNQQRKTSESLRESNQRFRSLVDAAPVMVWMSAPNAQCTFLNKPWLDFTGRSLQAQLGSGWLDHIHPQDRERCATLCQTAFEGQQGFSNEYRLLRHDGDYRWVLDYGVPRFEPDGKFVGFIGTCIDITDRKEAEDRLRQLSSQLINAQETERFRIGQELHDDLSQRAAALSMRLSHLSRKHDSNKTLATEFDRMWRQASDLCKDIARLSHQLHPTTLDRLGLDMALRSLCEQTSDDKQTVLLRCDEELPQLSNDVSVALYRIAQEALRNALKHSGASHIYVDLRSSRTHISLSIRDTGCGFVVGSVATRGLGLSGMTERMRSGGGSLQVLSSPGKGTTVIATVPILRSMKASG